MANRYLVLKLDFSHINTQTPENTYAGFLANVKHGGSIFLEKYAFCFAPDDETYILSADTPTFVMQRLFERFQRKQVVDQSAYKIYLLIDEYDHFANELVSFRIEEFKQSVSRNGYSFPEKSCTTPQEAVVGQDFSGDLYVRKFYENIKSATGDGLVDRIFITGVSPLTLDSLTSGFNIGTNLSLDRQFHNMLGFTEEEVATILTGVGVQETALPGSIADIPFIASLKVIAAMSISS